MSAIRSRPTPLTRFLPPVIALLAAGASACTAVFGLPDMVTPWRPASTSLLAERHRHDSVIVGSRLYVVGGYRTTDGGQEGSIESAPVAVDGTLGPFQKEQAAVLSEQGFRRRSRVVTRDQNLYVITHSSIYRFGINADGSLQAKVHAGSIDTTRVWGDGAPAVIGDYLYLFGSRLAGRSPYPVETGKTVFRARFKANGLLEAMQPVPDRVLTDSHNEGTCIVAGQYVYVLGGIDASLYGTSDPNPTATTPNAWLTPTATSVERAEIQSGGDLGPFAVVARLTSPRAHHASAVVGRYLYVLGGFGARSILGGNMPSAVERAEFTADGELGSFSAQPTLTRDRTDPSVAVVGTTLYVLGGSSEASIEQLTLTP